MSKGFAFLSVPPKERLLCKTRITGQYGGYRKTCSSGLMCLVNHATAILCRHNFNYKNDALEKTVGKMVGVARSVSEPLARRLIIESTI